MMKGMNLQLHAQSTFDLAILFEIGSLITSMSHDTAAFSLITTRAGRRTVPDRLTFNPFTSLEMALDSLLLIAAYISANYYHFSTRREGCLTS